MLQAVCVVSVTTISMELALARFLLVSVCGADVYRNAIKWLMCCYCQVMNELTLANGSHSISLSRWGSSCMLEILVLGLKRMRHASGAVECLV